MKAGVDYIGVGCGALIINDRGETLLLKRSKKSKNEIGMWQQPGGAVEYGEKVVEAITREVKEEVGVTIELTKFLGYTDHILNNENQHWLAVYYLARIVEGVPMIAESEKIDELRWFSLDNLPAGLNETTRDSIAYYANGIKDALSSIEVESPRAKMIENDRLTTETTLKVPKPGEIEEMMEKPQVPRW